MVASACLAQGRPAATGGIRGTIFIADSNGSLSVLPNATVRAKGPTETEVQSNDRGDHMFSSLEPGSYVITSSASGLNGATTVEVYSGAVSEIPLHVTVAASRTTVTVTASTEAAASETSAQSVTINSSAVNGAPNKNERFEELLPLVPGVIRGPDGRLNLKGASSTQASWLVNSANVTDPATGDKAMNLPIDLVSTVKVVSNPYDPEYGRFTGAISSVETRTGNFDSYHFSIQNLLPRPRKRGGDLSVSELPLRASL